VAYTVPTRTLVSIQAATNAAHSTDACYPLRQSPSAHQTHLFKAGCTGAACSSRQAPNIPRAVRSQASPSSRAACGLA
jgi:hypothetical protein